MQLFSITFGSTMRIVSVCSFLLLAAGPISMAQTVGGDALSGESSMAAPFIGTPEPVPPPIPPHLDPTPDPRFSAGFDIAMVHSWYGEMPLAGSALHGVGSVDASGLGYALGATGTLWINRSTRLLVGVRYVRQHVEWEQDATIPTELESGFEDTTYSSPPSALVHLSAESDFDLLQTSVMLQQDFAYVGPFVVSILTGPSFSYVLGNDRLELIDLVEPAPPTRFVNRAGLPTEQQGRRLFVLNDTPPDRVSVRPGIMAGLRFDLPLSWQWALGISFEYEYVFDVGREEGIMEPVDSFYGRVGIFRPFF